MINTLRIRPTAQSLLFFQGVVFESLALKGVPSSNCKQIWITHTCPLFSIVFCGLFCCFSQATKKCLLKIHLYPIIRKRYECFVFSSVKYKDLSSKWCLNFWQTSKYLCDIAQQKTLKSPFRPKFDDGAPLILRQKYNNFYGCNELWITVFYHQQEAWSRRQLLSSLRRSLKTFQCLLSSSTLISSLLLQLFRSARLKPWRQHQSLLFATFLRFLLKWFEFLNIFQRK